MERWKLVNEFPNYECSDLGNVRNIKTLKVLKGFLKSNGYIDITLFNGVKKHFYVHRLISIVWIENLENKPTVNHINGIKTDNRLLNLEWSTFSEQIVHFNLNNKKKYSTNNGIWMCDLNSNKIKLFKSNIEASNYLGHDKNGSSHISKSALGKIDSAYGYKWIYPDIISEVGEVWRRIPGNEKYKISNFGRVINPFNRLNKSSIRGGYEVISINGKTYSTHILVAKTFLKNPLNKKIVNHIDENRLNNKSNNLEWVTNSENILHSIRLKNK